MNDLPRWFVWFFVLSMTYSACVVVAFFIVLLLGAL